MISQTKNTDYRDNGRRTVARFAFVRGSVKIIACTAFVLRPMRDSNEVNHLETQVQVAASPRFRPGAILVALIAVTIFVLDQLTKMLVVQNIGMGNVWYPIPGFEWLRIVGSYNTGTACGYFPQLSIVFTIAPFFILAVVVWFYRSQKKPSWLLSIAIGRPVWRLDVSAITTCALLDATLACCAGFVASRRTFRRGAMEVLREP